MVHIENKYHSEPVEMVHMKIIVNSYISWPQDLVNLSYLYSKLYVIL
jgi:hypothetical protein